MGKAGVEEGTKKEEGSKKRKKADGDDGKEEDFRSAVKVEDAKDEEEEIKGRKKKKSGKAVVKVGYDAGRNDMTTEYRADSEDTEEADMDNDEVAKRMRLYFFLCFLITGALR